MQFTIPVDPDAEEARKWAEDELSSPVYDEEGASWWDTFLDWLEDLFSTTDTFGVGMPPLAVFIGIVIALAVVGLLVWLIMGPLRSSRRTQTGAALDPDDTRSAEAMRHAATQAAAQHDWDTAVMEMFRASARTAHERTLIDLSKGMTAREAAASIAATSSVSPTVLVVADDFDTARYGSGGLTSEAWERARAVDSEVANAHSTAGVSS